MKQVREVCSADLSKADKEIANTLLSKILAGDAMNVDKVRNICCSGDDKDEILEAVFEAVQANIQEGVDFTGTDIVPILVHSLSR